MTANPGRPNTRAEGLRQAAQWCRDSSWQWSASAGPDADKRTQGMIKAAELLAGEIDRMAEEAETS